MGTKPRKPRRYDFTITGHIDIEPYDFDALDRLIKIRRQIFAEIIPMMRKSGLRQVFLSDRKVTEDEAAIAMADAAAQQNAREEPDTQSSAGDPVLDGHT